MRVPLVPLPARLAALELIDRLERRDRTTVSTALLAIAGIGAGELKRRSVLARVSEAARSARYEGAISERRAAQIARHVERAIHRIALALPDTGDAVGDQGAGCERPV